MVCFEVPMEVREANLWVLAGAGGKGKGWSAAQWWEMGLLQ